MGYADLHIHTDHSFDGTASVREVLAAAKSAGLDVIAITDHDQIAGSLQAVQLAPDYGLQAIAGIEITTAEGDLLAYNIREKIAPHQSLVQSILQVAEQGGFCVAAHPMSAGMGMNSVTHYGVIEALRDERAARTLIGIETINATAIDQPANASAQKLALHTGLLAFGNSDAHISQTVGLGRTEYPGSGAADLLAAITSRQLTPKAVGKWSTAAILSSWARGFLRRKTVEVGTGMVRAGQRIWNGA